MPATLAVAREPIGPEPRQELLGARVAEPPGRRRADIAEAGAGDERPRHALDRRAVGGVELLVADLDRRDPALAQERVPLARLVLDRAPAPLDPAEVVRDLGPPVAARGLARADRPRAGREREPQRDRLPVEVPAPDADVDGAAQQVLERRARGLGAQRGELVPVELAAEDAVARRAVAAQCAQVAGERRPAAPARAQRLAVDRVEVLQRRRGGPGRGEPAAEQPAPAAWRRADDVGPQRRRG